MRSPTLEPVKICKLQRVASVEAQDGCEFSTRIFLFVEVEGITT